MGPRSHFERMKLRNKVAAPPTDQPDTMIASSFRLRHACKSFLFALAVVSAVGATPVMAGDAPAEWDGLARRESKSLDFLYVRPGASLAGYRSVQLDPVEVSFDKDWDPNRATREISRKLSAEDMNGIREDISAEFRKVFADELGKTGHSLVDSGGADVLRVSAAIVDLYITAPDKQTAGRSYTFVSDAGRMTLVAELRDAETGQVIARVVDRAQARQSGNFQFSSKMTNSAEARAAMRKWATALRKGMDEARGAPAGN